MRVLVFSLLALVSFSKTSDFVNENLRLKKTNTALLNALRSLSQEQNTETEKAVGADECWWHDGYEEDCPAGCVWKHFSRGTGMCNAPNVAAERSQLRDTVKERAVADTETEKAVGAEYREFGKKIWCRDWDSMSYDSLRTTPKVTYEECKQKCESIPTCNYFLHGERVMDSKMNRCVTWNRCDMRGGYNDGSPTIYERAAEWRSPFAYMDSWDRQDALIIG